MAQKKLGSDALSTFCGSMATMISAGIQTDEASYMLSDGQRNSLFQTACSQIYTSVANGDSLSIAMEKSGAFPQYAIDMVSAGERAGHLEQVLRNLELYYDEESRLFSKLRSSMGYPAALLCIMSVILGFTVLIILPIFTDVYTNMAGSLAVGSFSSVGISAGIGQVSFIVMTILAVLSLILALITGSPKGRSIVMDLLTRIPQTRRALYQLDLSRFTAALGTLVSSGIEDQESIKRAIATTRQPRLVEKLNRAAASMNSVDNPRSLVQALSECNVFEPLYARMLAVGMRSGNTDATLMQLSSTFFDDAVLDLDRALDNIEPILAALLTIAVGTTLIAVMLPLIGIMSSIG